MLRRLIERMTMRQPNGWTEVAVRELLKQQRLDEAMAAAQNMHPETPDRAAISLCLQGEIYYLRQQDQQAETCFRQALALNASLADAHLGLSMSLAEKQSLNAALEHALFAKNLQPENARILAQLGYCYMLLEGYPAAEGALRQALSNDPQDKRSWNNLAITLRARGDAGQAKACWLQALELDSDYAPARENMSRFDNELSEAAIEVKVQRNIVAVPLKNQTISQSIMPWIEIENLAQSDQLNAAINLAERTLPLEPTEAETLALNELYRRSGDWLTATSQLEAHLARHPLQAAVWRRLGDVHARRELHNEAIQDFHRALELGEESAELFAELSASMHALERYQDALDAIQRACALDKSSRYQKRLAATLVMCCRYEKAVEVYEQLAQEQSNSTNANHAVCLGYLGRLDEAIEILDTLVSTMPHDPAVRMMRGQMLLLKQEWKRGWSDYAWRGFNQVKDFRMLPFPRWQGESLSGKRVVVLAEQGLGDQVMFASCLPDLLAMAPAKTVMEAHERVARTLARSFPDIHVIPTRQKKDLKWVNELGRMDYFVSMGDLPGFFRTSSSSFPKQAFLKADPERISQWRKRLLEAGPAPYIGFSWKGGTEVTRSVLRTMQIQDFASMASMTPGTWISLQYGPAKEALDLARTVGFCPQHWPEAISDLDEFAALVSALDAVVTVCNTTVHYAGSLGRPTLVLAPKVPEWRYGIDDPTMPWYPHVEVLRQSKSGDWAPVVNRATAKLLKIVTKHQPRALDGPSD